MLILLDTGNAAQKRDRGYVLEMQHRHVLVRVVPAAIVEGLEAIVEL